MKDNKNTGHSTDYYKVHISSPAHFENPYDAECSDIIEALDMDFSEGEAFKAIWRKAARRLGNSKTGVDDVYDAEKIAHYGARIESIAKNKPSESVFEHAIKRKSDFVFGGTGCV